jgi:flagellar hook-length control protein FliK
MPEILFRRGFVVPSIPSGLSAVLSSLYSQWQQTPATGAETDAQQFSALLDAAAPAAPPPAAPPPTPAPAPHPQVPASSRQTRADTARSERSTGATKPHTATGSGAAAKGSRSAAKSSTEASAPAKGSTAPDPAADTSRRASQPDAAGSDTNDTHETAQPAGAPPSASSAGKAAADKDQDNVPVDPCTDTGPTGQAQGATDPAQPVAAIVLGSPEVAPAAGDGSTANLVPAGDARAGAATSLTLDAGQGGPVAQATRNGLGVKTGVNEDGAKNAPAPAGGPANASAAASGASPQTQTDTDNAVPVQNPSATEASASADSTRATARTSALAAASSPEARGANGGAVKTSPDGVPDFGFSTAATESSTAAAAPPRAAAAAVPIAGLAVAIAARAKDGANQFEIRLDPPELGRIDVRLAVDASGQVSSHVTVDRAETLQLLQSHQPQLERALEQAGLKTGDNGLQFTLRDQSFAGGNNNGSGAPPSAPRLVVPDADLPPVEATQIYSRPSLRGGIDIRV